MSWQERLARFAWLGGHWALRWVLRASAGGVFLAVVLSQLERSGPAYVSADAAAYLVAGGAAATWLALAGLGIRRTDQIELAAAAGIATTVVTVALRTAETARTAEGEGPENTALMYSLLLALGAAASARIAPLGAAKTPARAAPGSPSTTGSPELDRLFTAGRRLRAWLTKRFWRGAATVSGALVVAAPFALSNAGLDGFWLAGSAVVSAWAGVYLLGPAFAA